ncbi:MAG TPA: glycosyltransferase family 4 protein [Longimicrobium sp.]|jgi:glycosyltransferase involved in cell wall biosynthesis|nr:glycosyltransferase family 4 protein [Longimicrobium sp.]
MRILLTTDTVGGVWDYTVTLARQLDALGCEVLIAAIGEPRDERLAHVPAGVQVTSRTYRLEWMDGAAADVREAARWLRELSQLWAADVVHLNQLAYAAFGFPAPVVTVAHSDVLSWWTAVRGGAAPAEWEPYASWATDGLLASNAVVAPTSWHASQLADHYGVHGARVIHNGAEPPAAEPAPKGEPLVLCVGRAWDEGKGVDLLDAAVGMLGPGFPPVHLLGESVAPHGGVFEARNLVMHGRVERTAVDAWMRRATVYVAPSRYEPFGLAPLEAALNGCALVLSDIGTFRELWDGCADFFPSGDAAALAGVLGRLATDPARVAKMAERARGRALRRYGAARMAGDYLALYRELAARPEQKRSVA